MAAEGIGELNIEKAQEYAANVGKIAGAVQALKGTDGWQIFLALFYRHKKDVAAKEYGEDHAALVEFKGDRKAIHIVEDLFAQMDGMIEDAEAAAKALGDISGDEEPPRGIMLIEAVEESNREA